MFPKLTANHPALVLAPMEGVTDAPMRATLTERSGFQFCVSEFLRVSDRVPPSHVYFDHVPELKNGCRTPSGTPIQIQILGGHPERMALAAMRAVELGAQAIDINFGCPAPTVNRHDGGASILKTPCRVREIVSAIRQALPKDIPVSAKLRLGWESMEDIFATAAMAVEGGADWLTIHARTKMQGYRPPAYWKYIGEVNRLVPVPVVANGEIWSLDDFRKCRDQTGCEHFMLGRGALSNPNLVYDIAEELGIPFSRQPLEWPALLDRFAEHNHPIEPPEKAHSHYLLGRMKQWLNFVNMKAPISNIRQLRQTQSLSDFMAEFMNHITTEWRPRHDSNVRPSAPEADALSN